MARFMRPTWDPPGADRTQVAPCWPHEPCNQGNFSTKFKSLLSLYKRQRRYDKVWLPESESGSDIVLQIWCVRSRLPMNTHKDCVYISARDCICIESIHIEQLASKCNNLVRKLLCPALYIDGLGQERRNSIANALELHLSCTNPSICAHHSHHVNIPPTSTDHNTQEESHCNLLNNLFMQGFVHMLIINQSLGYINLTAFWGLKDIKAIIPSNFDSPHKTHDNER